jgi:hypothetical protein
LKSPHRYLAPSRLARTRFDVCSPNPEPCALRNDGSSALFGNSHSAKLSYPTNWRGEASSVFAG